jgi:succinoglycan biosynthesis transport protein ExoP
MSQDNRLLPSLPVERGLDRPLSDLSQPKSYGSSLAEPAHLREYLNVVLKRKWLILSLVLVVTSLVSIHMYRTPSVFEAATTIDIEPKRDNPLATGKGGVVINTGRTTDPTYVNTQLRLLENPALARQVIRTLDLQNNPAFLGGQTQTGFLASVKRIFAGEKKAAQPSEPANGTLQPVRADEVKDDRLTKEELDKLEPYELTLAANLTVEPIVGTNLVTLHFRHSNPELARQVVNTLADTFIYNNGDRETSSTQTSLEQLGNRIAELQQVIHAEEEQRVNFLQSKNLPVDGMGDNLPAKRQTMLSEQLLTAENERKDKEAIYRAAAASPDPWSIPEVQESKRVQELRKQVDDLKLKREDMLQTYTEAWPAVKKLEAQIKPLEEMLQKAPAEVVSGMKTRYESAKAREDSLRAAYNLQSGQTTDQNRAQIQLSVLKRELETNQQEYDTLRQRQRELENNAATGRQNNVSVTNYARVPHQPVGPARAQTIVLAFLLSLGVGVGLAFLLDYLDDTLKTVDDVDRYLHLPSLALIPASRAERTRLIGKRAAPAASEGEPSTALALTSDVRSASAEAYRHLRTSLLLSSAGQPPKTILVTSSQPSEGKTTTAVNTAIMLAQTGAQVLIVDCDLRRPRVHANFNLSNARGLTNYLSGERDLDALVQTYEKLPNLKIMSSGPIPPNPAELLGSTEMRRLLDALSERFTHIVIDSPPAISFTDASILSTLVDGVMLVVHSGRSSRNVVRRAKQQLVDVGANIFGVVLNNVSLDAPDYYYSGYYSSYYAQQDYEDEPEASQSESAVGRAG